MIDSNLIIFTIIREGSVFHGPGVHPLHLHRPHRLLLLRPQHHPNALKPRQLYLDQHAMLCGPLMDSVNPHLWHLTQESTVLCCRLVRAFVWGVEITTTTIIIITTTTIIMEAVVNLSRSYPGIHAGVYGPHMDYHRQHLWPKTLVLIAPC